MRYFYYALSVFAALFGFLILMIGVQEDRELLRLTGGSMIGSVLILLAVGRLIGVLEDIREAVSEEPE
jgi:hypothetical protein